MISICHSLKNIILYVFCNGDFTLTLLKNIKKNDSAETHLSMFSVGQREKINSALTSS